MKKLTAAILALVLTFSLSATAFAEEINQEGNTNVEITASVAPTYTVTIPTATNVTFNKTSTSFGKVALTAARLEPGASVKVTLTADNTLKNKADGSKTIAYTITDSNGTDFSEKSFTTVGEEVPLTINITQDEWNKAYAGDYEDIVIFKVAYVSQ